jgi:hypothetical protein
VGLFRSRFFTVVNATGYGWLRAYPYGGSGNASVINYKAGDTIANGLILPLCDPALASCTRDLTVVADSYGGHVVLDVMGYFQYVNKANYRSTVTTAIQPNPDGVYLPGGAGCLPIISVSVVAAGPGTIHVEGTGGVYLHHVFGTPDGVIWTISQALDQWQCLQRGTIGFDSTIASIEGSVPPGIYLEWRQARYVATVSSAGTYTFYLNAVNPNLNNSPTPNFQFGNLTATFHPQ